MFAHRCCGGHILEIAVQKQKIKSNFLFGLKESLMCEAWLKTIHNCSFQWQLENGSFIHLRPFNETSTKYIIS